MWLGDSCSFHIYRRSWTGSLLARAQPQNIVVTVSEGPPPTEEHLGLSAELVVLLAHHSNAWFPRGRSNRTIIAQFYYYTIIIRSVTLDGNKTAAQHHHNFPGTYAQCGFAVTIFPGFLSGARNLAAFNSIPSSFFSCFFFILANHVISSLLLGISLPFLLLLERSSQVCVRWWHHELVG